MAGKSEEVRGRRKFLRTGIVGAVAAVVAPKLNASVWPHLEVTLP